MSNPAWYRSLYWRIALGFVALVATLLGVQGLVFLWMTGRMTDLFPSHSPAQFAATIATDLGTTLAGRPDIDLDSYLYDKYRRAFHSYVVVTLDGRTIVSRHIPPPPDTGRMARARLFGVQPPPRDEGPGRTGGPDWERGPGRPGGPEGGGRGPRPDGPGRGGPGPGPMRWEFATIVLDGAPFGLVAVPSQPPPLQFTLRNVGPTLAAVALGLLVVGTTVAALLVFRPAERRLRGLQQAASALGAGQSGVRAPETGGDEVASLARTFNTMADRLEERTRALAAADRTRRQLLADVSHELSTPLSAIRGYVETLQMTDLTLDEATKRRCLQIVTDETERLEHIIGDLLDLARLEGGPSSGAIRDEVVPVRHLFERLAARHGRTLDERHITLETAGAEDVPALRGDRARLEQALQNLVANAVRHTPEGGRISVGALREGNSVRFVVEDTGPGISPEHLPHVFDRFYKADASRAGTSVPSGSGLGLSIVQAIVLRHGGTVTAQNVPHGALFEITLPGRLVSGVAAE